MAVTTRTAIGTGSYEGAAGTPISIARSVLTGLSNNDRIIAFVTIDEEAADYPAPTTAFDTLDTLAANGTHPRIRVMERKVPVVSSEPTNYVFTPPASYGTYSVTLVVLAGVPTGATLTAASVDFATGTAGASTGTATAPSLTGYPGSDAMVLTHYVVITDGVAANIGNTSMQAGMTRLGSEVAAGWYRTRTATLNTAMTGTGATGTKAASASFPVSANRYWTAAAIAVSGTATATDHARTVTDQLGALDSIEQPVSNLTEAFDAGSIDTAKWANNFGSVSQSGGYGRVPAAAGGGIDNGFGSTGAYSLVGDELHVLVQQLPSLDASSFAWASLTIYTDRPTYTSFARILLTRSSGGVALSGVVVVGGTTAFTSGDTSVTDGPTWLRLRESGGTLFGDYSANGVDWTNAWSTTVPGGLNLRAVEVDLEARRSATTGDGSPALFDRLNLPPDVQDHEREITDGLGLLDAVVAAQTIPRTVSDTLGATDALTRVAAAARTAVDQVNAGDSVGSVAESMRTVADPTTISDAIASPAVIVREIIDGVDLEDSAAAAHGWGAVLVEAVGIVDVGEQQSDATRAGVDSVSLEDTVEPAQGWHAALSDSLGIGDTATAGRALSSVVTDAIGVEDTVDRSAAAVREPVDPVEATDATARTVAATRTGVDDLGVADLVERAASRDIELVDELGGTDAAASALGAVRVAADALGAVDSHELVRDTHLDLVDELGALDAVDNSLDTTLYRFPVDVAGLTDTAAAALDASRTGVDELDLADTVEVGQGHVRIIADPLGAVDAVGTGRNIVVELVEVITATDVVEQARDLDVELHDELGAVDVVTRSHGWGRFALDSLAATDQAGRMLAALRTGIEPLGLRDMILRDGDQVVEIVDTLGGLDQVGTAQGWSARVVDELGALDSTSRTTAAQRELVDALPVTDRARSVGGQPAVLVPGSHDASSSQAGLITSHEATRMESSP